MRHHRGYKLRKPLENAESSSNIIIIARTRSEFRIWSEQKSSSIRREFVDFIFSPLGKRKKIKRVWATARL